MPFGKRGQIEVEDAPSVTTPIPMPPPNPTFLESMAYLWKICHAVPAGQGFITLGYHYVTTVVLAIAILFVRPAALTRLASALTPYWPLLSRARPYMDAHGHHELFLYMSAMYFKEIVLMALFSLRNVFWSVIAVKQFISKIKLQFQWSMLYCFAAPLFLYFAVVQIYYGPDRIPDHSYLGNTIFDGGVFRGLVVPTLLLDPLGVLFLFAAPLCIFFPPGRDGSYVEKIKRMRQMRKFQ